MKFEAKVFKLGHSRAVYIPKEFEIGKVYTFSYEEKGTPEQTGKEVYTEPPQKVYTEQEKQTSVYTSSRFDFCKKHRGSLKTTCGCK